MAGSAVPRPGYVPPTATGDYIRRAPGTPIWTFKPYLGTGGAPDSKGRNRVPPESRGQRRYIEAPRVVGSVLGNGPVPRRQTSVPTSLLGGGY
jgi:hypothetical protein